MLALWLLLGTHTLSSRTESAGVRPLHWVIRASSLERTLDFTQNVLGMKVLRHEENEKACPMSNGNFNSSWSKTIVGFGTEEKHFMLEVIYNYGISSYPKGVGLQRFILNLVNVQESIGWAKRLGYAVEGNSSSALIVGPDGYIFDLRSETPTEIQAVVLQAENLELVAAWYEELLGFSRTDDAGENRMVLELRNRSFQYVLEASPTTPAPTDWDGRNVIAVPERQLRNIYTWLSQESPLAILHELREVEDTLGILLFTVLQDPGGYELCLVSLESFDMAIARRTSASSTFPTNSEL